MSPPFSTRSISRETSTTTRATTAISTRTTTPKQSSQRRSARRTLAAATAWSLLAFGGLYTWTLVPLLMLAGVALIQTRPRVGGGRTRVLDLALVACLAAVALQIVPVNG